MAVQTLHLPHTPPNLAVHVALYKDVHNAASLRQRLLAGDAQFEYAFIDASMIVSTVHALAAVYRGLNDHLQGRQKSKNIHSEIVFVLGPSNNITESFRRFGVGEQTRSLLVFKVATTPEITRHSVQQHLDDAIQGTAIAFSDENLRSLTDYARVRQVYRLSGNKSGGSPDSPDRSLKELEVAVLGAMALRSVA